MNFRFLIFDLRLAGLAIALLLSSITCQAVGTLAPGCDTNGLVIAPTNFWQANSNAINAVVVAPVSTNTPTLNGINSFTGSNNVAAAVITNLYTLTNAVTTFASFGTNGLLEVLDAADFIAAVGAVPATGGSAANLTVSNEDVIGTWTYTNGVQNGWVWTAIGTTGLAGWQPSTGGGGAQTYVPGTGLDAVTNGSIVTLAATGPPLDGTNTWTGTNTIGGITLDPTASKVTATAFAGSGAAVTGIQPANISGGTLSANINATNISSSWSGTFTGTHVGDGGALTNLHLQNIDAGTNSNNLTFDGSITFNGTTTFNGGGGLSRNAALVITTNYTMTASDSFVVETGTARTVTLPAVPTAGLVYRVAGVLTTVVVATGTTATINSAGAGTGGTTQGVSSQTYGFMYDGVNWWVCDISN